MSESRVATHPGAQGAADADQHVDVRLFRRLMEDRQLLAFAVGELARSRCQSLMLIHKSGLKPFGRPVSISDFELDRLKGLFEVLTGAPLPLDSMMSVARQDLDSILGGSAAQDPFL